MFKNLYISNPEYRGKYLNQQPKPRKRKQRGGGLYSRAYMRPVSDNFIRHVSSVTAEVEREKMIEGEPSMPLVERARVVENDIQMSLQRGWLRGILLQKEHYTDAGFISFASAMPSTSYDICHKPFSRHDFLLRHKRTKHAKLYSRNNTTSSQGVIKFQHPFTMIVAGPTMSGKSSWMKQLLLSDRITPPPDRIIWLYKRWQPLYDELKDRIPHLEFIRSYVL